ncbi:MAG: hypothetical protein IPN57_09705 [Ignavibacteria bacterium]|nr:hypothetical protein [Ignavibacteria bacterium]
MYNRELFFHKYHNYFGSINQSQVDGLEFLLSKFDNENFSAEQVAYMLATVKWETAHTFQPIEERGGYNYFKYLIGKLGIRNLIEANKFKGRGYIMITGRTNFEKFSLIMGIDFITNPELVREPENAYKIMIYGFVNGTFTGKKLTDYIDGDKLDYYNARRIINGTDKASLIQGYAEKIFEGLKYE